MKSSKNSKTDVDDISRETQRLIKDSHVCLPYHKPKQKSLKDFLNRQKITPEYRASLTGSKKLLKKAWELIENKQRNVEKFYNEDSVEENTVTSGCDNVQVKKTVSLNDNDYDDNNDDDDDNNISLNRGKCMALELSDEEKSVNSSSDEENAEDNKFSTNYNDDENSNQSKSSEETPSQQSNNENFTNNLELENLEDDSSDLKDAMVNQFIDDEAESSELDCSSDEEDRPDFIDNSEEEDEDISKKKKRRIVLLSESSDEEDLSSDVNFKSDGLISITDEPAINMSTQQLMDLCSGQFQTQLSGAEGDHSDQELEDDGFDSEVPLNETESKENEDDELTSSKNFKNDFEPDILQSDDDASTNYENELEALKLTSAKDFFDEEAELSESDWSSDDEDHLVESIDILEEEAGDKDKLDEEVVKDGLDKIYMRQLLDDDNQQVTALKEMLLEDGELHSDSGRKRKFQWDEVDEDTAFKKPLFSDNEDENDEALSDDEKSVQWRKERFKRESFLSQKNDSESEEENDPEESSDDVQSLVAVVKKTHVVKFEKNENIKMTNNTICVEKCDIAAKAITKTDDIAQNLNKCVRGSFMKHNSKKMTTTLLYMNKKSSNNDNGKSQESSEIKSLTTIVAKAGSNPFAYLLRNQKPDTKNITSDDSINILREENLSQNKTSTNIQSTEKYHQNNKKKSTTSILKLLE